MHSALTGEDAAFEEWYTQTSRDQVATWHPNEKRYTKLSAKQSAWEVWQAKSAQLDVENIKLRAQLAELKLELAGVQTAKRALAKALRCSEDARWNWLIERTESVVRFAEKLGEPFEE